MKLTAYAALFCLAAVTFAQEATDERRGYSSTALPGGVLEQPFVRMGPAVLIEDVLVNGEGPFRFMLDTGAQGAGRVDRALVEALGLETTGSSTGIGIRGETLEMTRHELGSLAIGGLTFSGVRVSSRDYNAELPPPLRPLHGILGYDLFREYLLTVDYPARTLGVTTGALPPPDGKRVLPILSGEDGLLRIEVRIGDRTFPAVIDTGAMCQLLVPEAIAEELQFLGEPNARRIATLDGVLHIGSLDFLNPQAIVAGSMSHITIGVQCLASLTLTIDQQNARLLVERPAERKRHGLHLSKHGAQPWEFKGVIAGSLAEAAGLRATDRLLSINGRPLDELGREELDTLLDASQVTFGIERDGAQLELSMTLN